RRPSAERLMSRRPARRPSRVQSVAPLRARNSVVYKKSPFDPLGTEPTTSSTSLKPLDSGSRADINDRRARGSSNGRTADSGSVYQGSNPCPRTNQEKASKVVQVRTGPIV